MKTSEEVWQLAAILGKSDFFGCLSLTEEVPLDNLTPEQVEKVNALAAANVNRITRTLVHEAAGKNEIKTAPQAEAYLEERLNFFGDLLSENVRGQVREGFKSLTANWGT